MPLKVLSLSQAEQWDTIVRSFWQYDVYWLSGYVRAFELHGDGEPLLFYYDSNRLRGINVVLKRDIADDSRFSGRLQKGECFDLITPYGYGGWLLDADGDPAELFADYEKWCADNGVITEFVRYHPVLQNHKNATQAYEVIGLGHTIALDISSPQTIWENLTCSNRNKVRKARKSGITIGYGREPQLYKAFRTIYNSTMDKDAATPYYYFSEAFYESVRNDLPAESIVFFAELDGRVIASAILLAANGRLNYHLSGSVQEFQAFAPTNLLLYEAAMWGCANGCKTFHLGGGVGSHEDSLYIFKASFYRGEPCRFHIGRKIFNQEQYNRLVGMRNSRELNGSAYFPLYRA